MPTITEMIDSAERKRDAAVGRQLAAERQLDGIRSTCRRAGREPSASEQGQIRSAVADVEQQRETVRELDAKLTVLRAERECDDEADRLARINVPTGVTRAPSYDQVARVGQEARTYRADQDPDGQGFLLDMSRAFMFGDPSAQERLQRHAAEDRVEHARYVSRATGTGAFAGLTVPQYLTDLYAPAAAALRPFADNCTTRHLLPEQGMTVNISRITTTSSVALQASENTGVSETDMDDTLLTLPILTAAGQQTISRQAIERGTGIEAVTMQDMINRHATVLDSTLLNQATTGLSAVAQATSYTDATPTVAELWLKLFQSQNNVETALLAQAFPTHHVMHPRRWNWLCSQVSSSWPSIGSASLPPQLFAQVETNAYGVGTRAILSNGMRVVTDANITTTAGAGTEDEIYTVAQAECHLWEDPNAPLFIRAEQTKAASLGVLLVVYSYFGYTFSRYTNAVGKIGGTGLIAPTF